MFIDITVTLDNDLEIYPNNPFFCIHKTMELIKGDPCNISKIQCGTHTGTHIDAPLHFIENGLDIAQIPLEKINGKAKVIEIFDKTITLDFIKSSIQKNDIILFKTQNSILHTPNKVRQDYVTLDYQAADYLAYKKIKLVGIDYMTIEPPKIYRQSGKSIHKTLLGASIIIAETLDLKNVQEGEYEFYCFPLKIPGADGSPVRAVLKPI